MIFGILHDPMEIFREATPITWHSNDCLPSRKTSFLHSCFTMSDAKNASNCIQALYRLLHLINIFRRIIKRYTDKIHCNEIRRPIVMDFNCNYIDFIDTVERMSTNCNKLFFAIRDSWFMDHDREREQLDQVICTVEITQKNTQWKTYRIIFENCCRLRSQTVIDQF